MKVYEKIATLVQAIRNCEASGNEDWRVKHSDVLDNLVWKHMPSGSGFDNGTKLDLEASTPEKLVFTTAFHHMDANGTYDGWTRHTITVKPSLARGFMLRISGPDRNQIKDHFSESFHHALLAEVECK